MTLNLTLPLLASSWSPSAKLALTAAAVFCGVALVFRVGFMTMRLKELRAQLLETLAATVRRGLPLGPVFRHAAPSHPRRHRRRLALVAMALDDGVGLGQALDAAGAIVSPHATAAIVNADGTPYLADALAACAEEERSRRVVLHRVILATAYPALVALLVTPLWGAIGRKLLEVSESMEMSVPALDGVRLAGDMALALVIAVVGALLIARIFHRVYHGGGGFGRALRAVRDRIPAVGRVNRLGSGAAVLRASAGLLRTGAPLGDAMRRSAPLSSHGGMRIAAERVADELDAGEPADLALAGLPLPASICARAATACGGRGAVLADRLEELANECEQRYRNALEGLLRWVHPAGLLFIGVVVALHFHGVFQMFEQCREVAKPW